MKAGLAVAQMFRDYGARYMFGMPGGQHWPIYAGIAELRPAIDHVSFRSEKDAAFAAFAYALVTGRPGICDGTVGPGATNLVSGVAEAWAASIPVVAVSGDVPTAGVGRWAAQEIDMRQVLRQFTKGVFRAERVDKIPELVRAAFRLATSGRPGPVHLVFPADLIAAEHDFGDALYVEPENGVFPARRSAPDPAAVERAIDVIVESKRPVLFAGGGVLSSGASAELQEFAELTGIPVATSMMGKGSIPEDHRLALGAAVTFFTPACTYQMRGHEEMAATDLAILVGTRTDEAATAGWRMPRPGTPCIHLDIDPAEIGRNYPVRVGLVGDAKLGLRALIDAYRRRSSSGVVPPRGDRAPQLARAVERWRAAVEPKLTSAEVPITGHRVVRELQAALDPTAIIVTDASLVPYYTGAFFDLRRSGRSFVSPRGLGSLGSSVPMMIGAALAAPDRQVVAFGGDGGFAMAVGELETAVRSGIRAVYVLLNNSALGYGVMTQGPDISQRYVPVRYAEAAEAFGCLGIRVEDPADLAGAIRTALASDRPALIEVISAIEMPTSAGAAIIDTGSAGAGG